MADDIYVARSGFSAFDPKTGEHIRVMEDQLARAGHWLIEINPQLWRPIRVDYESPSKREEARQAKAAAKAEADAKAAQEKAAADAEAARKAEAERAARAAAGA